MIKEVKEREGGMEARMIGEVEVERYRRSGFIVVESVLSERELAALRETTDALVEGASKAARNDELYDLERGHTPEKPRVRRIVAPHRHHEAYAAMVRHAGIIAVLRQLLGSDIRFDNSKLNMKGADGGSAVEWHQDWAFYPHTNDDLAAVGIMIDDCGLDNGPLLVLPGSHRGPVYDHHANGRFCGAIDVGRSGLDVSEAVPLTGRAGSITVHHARLVHGSAVNRSRQPRRILFHQYRAADAWPLRGVADFDEWEASMVSGHSTIEPRLAALPVRMPLPPAARPGSIYENQRALRSRWFERTAGGESR